jgi:cyanophycinase
MRIPKPKGTLIPIGGGEDKTDKKEVLRRIIAESGKRSPKICLITVATTIPKEVALDYRRAFRSIDHNSLFVLHFDLRLKADAKKNLDMIKKCDVVLFSGGDQLKLSSLMGGTKLLDIIKTRYFDEPKFVVAGTSAGAAAMSDTMIISGSSKDAMIKGELELTNGLDLISNIFIDTHFTERGRFGRLVQTVTCNPGVLGIGLGENTAMVIYKGEEIEVVGTGLVVIVDGTDIEYTNLTDVSDGEPITVEGLKMHVLGPGRSFLLSKKEIK